jgi:hypothetical protein
MRPRIFGQDANILAGRAGTTAGTVRQIAAHMEERQHHLNESSSARLGRSQKLEYLPSPKNKSLGAYFLGAYIFHKAQRFQGRLVIVVYYKAQIF